MIDKEKLLKSIQDAQEKSTMNPTKLSNIFHDLASTSSRNEKERILREMPEECVSDFMRIAKLTYNPRINFYVKDFQIVENCDESDDVFINVNGSLDEALDVLEHVIAKRKVTGNAALSLITNTIKQLDSLSADIFTRVLNRDLECGASAKTFNKVWPGLIPDHPYMRCSGFDEKVLSKLTFPCYSQVKMDGLYVDIVVTEDKEVNCYTRSGQDVTHYLRDEDIDALSSNYPNLVFQGEALVLGDDGEILDRKTGNGILNSDDVDPQKIIFVIWDCVYYDKWSTEKAVDKTPYHVRLAHVENIVNNFSLSFHPILTKTCYTTQDIIDHFKDVRLKGQEGTIIKSENGFWKSGTSKDQVKCKVVFDCDLKVVGYKLGTGKYENKLGALLCESSDGKVCVSVGGGYKDEERETLLENIDDVIGKIAVVRANDLVNDVNDKEGAYSLFLPRFVEIRSDKTEADTFDKIQQQIKEFTNVLEMIK